MSPGRHLARLFTICLSVSVADLAAGEEGDSTPESHQNGNFWDAIVNGKVKALFRYSGQNRNSNLHLLQDSTTPDISDEKRQSYSALGGFVGYETRPWFNTSFGATVYAALPLGSNPADRKGLGGLYEGNGDQDPYVALGEAYAKYQYGGHLLKAGRQEMPNYRFVSLSNIRFSPITHSGAVYENRAHDTLQFNLGYIARMKERNDWRFIDMARGARLQESTNGKQLIRGDYNPDDYDETGYIGANKEMAMASMVYSEGRSTFEAWNYYIKDFVNTLYLYGDYGFQPDGSSFTYTLAAQYTNQQDVGGHIAGNIDTYHWGVSVRASSAALSWFVAYNKVAYNEESYDGGTLFVRWGTPQMFMSFQVQDSELAGTRSVGAGLQYDFGHNGTLPGLVMRWRYGDYNLPDDLLMTDARQDRAEATFDLRYSFTRKSGFGIFTDMQGLSIQFRLAYNNYRTDYNFEAYREIHGYDFETATKDFWDARLYLDYRF
jgi:hypothetical protein